MRSILKIAVILLLLGTLLLLWNRVSLGRPSPKVAEAARIIEERAQQAVRTTKTNGLGPKVNSSSQARSTPRKELHEFISLSSFFAPSDVVGFSDEQIAALEIVLGESRRQVYALLIERGVVSRDVNGFSVGIQECGRELASLKEATYTAVASIVGPDAFPNFAERAMGKRFAALFAYFGEFDTIFDVRIEKASSPVYSDYVVFRSDFQRAGLFGMRISSTSQLKREAFERDFFPSEILSGK
ncbi:MAG: hypothetical protein C0518_04015 [Opitutus sp.]|nr:hypothetical protein [Opitutus sp.]